MSNSVKVFGLFFPVLFLIGCSLGNSSAISNTPTIDEMIGQMLLVGFRGTEIDDNSPIKRDIEQYQIGGVILFDYDVQLKERGRNIVSPQQVKRLTDDLKEISKTPLFIAVDQEGGNVARLNPNAGFAKTPTHLQLVQIDSVEELQHQLDAIASMLEESGFNLNFAPVVDLNVNPENPAIGRWERAFSADYEVVTALAEKYIDSMSKRGVLSCIKHFPGHGSAFNDSHYGVTDITETWNEDELLPYSELIERGKVQMIMTGHLFHSSLDDQHPATLSSKTITGLLRDELGFKGVIISDDLEMKAITEQYSLKNTIEKAINAGVDILLFANNMDYNPDIVPTAFSLIKELLSEGAIQEQQLRDSYLRISALKKRLN